MALIGAARGHSVVVVMPNTISKEKIDFMGALGARVVAVDPAPFSDPKHYVHTAKRIAEATPGGVYGNQFESLENMRAHLFGTGPEIWEQTEGKVDGFVAAAGTGGTICGMSHALKERKPAVRVYLIDPPGSSLAAFVEDGELRPSPGSTVTEGIGIGRLTNNFAAARVDGVFQGHDDEALAMKLYLTRYEGINVGPSAALNVVGAVKLARVLGPDSTVVTILCDSGERYSSAAWNKDLGSEAVPGSAASMLKGPGNIDFVRA
jgi:cysteine synthase A